MGSESSDAAGLNRLPWHFLAGVGVLLLTMAAGEAMGEPVRNIIPYALATGLTAWRNGWTGGLIGAALASVAAVAGGALTHRPEAGGLIAEGLVNYIELSAVVFGVVHGRKLRGRRRASR